VVFDPSQDSSETKVTSMDAAQAEPRGSLIDKLNLRWLLRLLSSSIGRKFVMAVTGLGLSLFLVVHLAGNLFLFAGAEKFNNYAHALHEQEWLPLAEAGLFLLFLAHIYLAVSLTLDNRRKRTASYAKKESKIADRSLVFLPANWMFASGAVVLGFLILHIIDMKLALRPDVAYVPETDPSAPFANTTAVLRTPLTFVVYSAGLLFLGFHLSHGVASAFQSLGWNHPKYMPLITVAGVLFAVVIAAGFFSLAICGFFNALSHS
jgi:succinate dehydrogenase / fumarate reductase cytochrome b subunit